MGVRLQPYLFFYPSLLLVAAVSFVPLFYAVRQSFHAADYLQTGAFVGFANYIALFTTGGGLTNTGRSIVFVLGTLALTMPLGIGLALLLNQDIKYRGFFRTVLMIPWIVSQLVTGLLWMWLYDGRVGPVAHALSQIGIKISGPLTDTSWAMASLIVANTWHSYPLVMVFTLAALQTIPPEVREASRIDAASSWRRFLHVTLPLIRNTVMVALVLTTLHTFNTVTTVLIMTGGGPAEVTDVLALRVFKEGFTFYRMEVASAAAVLIFGLNIAFSIAYIRVLRSDRA
ncbi:sn-glycerol-3-phosphate transport system permease protein UgpA [Usitatibacter rugosus]|uniref:sn-glycerol-3-phosphate transport system permease protein UgpA n=1 Tax=Usitatibacter rugosus TaxID=2732067 RepID=A0A6M4GQI6_9PROT|nr:sugar ABC transporter permease [Usitatibacter rugosus]QJR09610.1 sn-glycerol-3-phosphate transport system permease protein UgpA [Usitatibacter rugosus]